MSDFNCDHLRTFLAIAETGSVTEGAMTISRSQSAASLQMKRLEEAIGQPVFVRHGRGIALTQTGERLLPVARDVINRLDAAMREFSSNSLRGRLRCGLPDDLSKRRISRIVGAFAQSHPWVELDVHCALSTGFPKATRDGSLDIAIYEIERAQSSDEIIWEEKTFWMTSRYHDLLTIDPLPVALFDRDCWWRDAAMSALHQLNRPFRIVYSSQSVAGVAAAIEAGIAIGLLGEASLNDNLKVLGPKQHFKKMPTSKLVLTCNENADTEIVNAMKMAIRREFSVQ